MRFKTVAMRTEECLDFCQLLHRVDLETTNIVASLDCCNSNDKVSDIKRSNVQDGIGFSGEFEFALQPPCASVDGICECLVIDIDIFFNYLRRARN